MDDPDDPEPDDDQDQLDKAIALSLTESGNDPNVTQSKTALIENPEK